MTTWVAQRPFRGLAVGALLALLLAGATLAQYLRTSWPFRERNSGALVPLMAPKPAAAQEAAPMAPMAGHGSLPQAAAAAGSPPSGYAAIKIEPGQAAALQLTTAPVEVREFKRVVRTVGVVTLDETRTAHVHSKVRGWIDGIHVDFVGRKVRAGEPLCSIYSQDVYAAEIELLSLLDRPSTSATGPPTGATAPDALPDPILVAARQRLALWDVPKSEIRRLESTREARQTFPLLAPRAGTVIAKEALQGMNVDPSVELYTLSDLTRLWVLVDVYEADVPYVHVGDPARLTIEGSAIEGSSGALEAKVAFLSPTLDEATRTRKVRFELRNPDGRLLPGAFASVELDLAMGKGLAVPEGAVIRTGKRSIAFVAHGDPAEHLEPRELKLGPLVGDSYRVEAGLVAGERVATGAQFLLDSESRLKATSGTGGAHAH